MKFDFCIGNPAYNESFDKGDGNETFAAPIYHKFIDEACKIAEKVEMIHPARFLFNAGSTPKAWNEKMLSDEHFKVLQYEEDCRKIFANTEIKGGVAITYRDKNKIFGAIGTFTPYSALTSILKKVEQEKMESLSDIIFTQTKFNLDNLYADHPQLRHVIGSNGKDRRFRNNIFDKVPVFYKTKQRDSVQVIGVVRNIREWRYISTKYVDNDHENLELWKVITPRANGSGKFGESMSASIVGGPGIGYTQTFIGIGAFATEEEAKNAYKYIKTKFCRAMLGVLKVTQDNDREAWRKVPVQNFTRNSDINWDTSISKIDKQLYAKYHLTQEEIDFIETHVKEME